MVALLVSQTLLLILDPHRRYLCAQQVFVVRWFNASMNSCPALALPSSTRQRGLTPEAEAGALSARQGALIHDLIAYDPVPLPQRPVELSAYLLADTVVHLALSPLVSRPVTVRPLPSPERYHGWIVRSPARPLCAINAIAFVGRTRMRAL